MTLIGAMTLCGAAVAGSVEDYVDLRTAELIDTQCEVLKYVEFRYLIDAQFTALQQTAEWGWLKSGRFTQEQYNSWIDARNVEARTKADETGGCTQAAGRYLLLARDRANARIAQDLLLALHFDSLAETDLDRRLLEADQKQSVMAYDAFLQQVYGASYQDFMAFQRQQAVSLLPVSSGDPYDLDTNAVDALYARSAADTEKVSEAQRRAILAIGAVQFEVMAESNGWRVLPLGLEGGWVIPTLRRADVSDRSDRLVVVAGPDSYGLADYSGSFQQLLAQAPDGTVRLMVFGEVAARLGPNPGARLYIPSMPLPVGVDDWSYFNQPGFRDLAMVWDGVPAASACLGGPCFDFPPEVFDAIGRRGANGQVELFIADSPDALPGPITPGSYRSGRIASRHFFTLMPK
ncbi:hypothetical protein [Devosia sp.]|uniref:hypothetical protein n=1 Tax=Devosia sp. TaxID=1871048 RepID=UPI003F70AA9F